MSIHPWGKKKKHSNYYITNKSNHIYVYSLYTIQIASNQLQENNSVNIIKLIHYENFNCKGKCCYSASVLIQFSFNVAKFINSETNSIQAIKHLLHSWFIKRLFSQTYRRGFSFKLHSLEYTR